jgi:hypothetical protein
VTVTGVGDGEGEGAVVGAVVGTGTGPLVGAVVGTGTGTGTGAGAVVGAGAAWNVGAVAGMEGAVLKTPTGEVDPVAAAGWAAAGRGTTEPAGLCVGTEPEPVVVVLGRGAGVAAGMPAGAWTARGR